jgi:hypothetical protein
MRGFGPVCGLRHILEIYTKSSGCLTPLGFALGLGQKDIRSQRLITKQLIEMRFPQPTLAPEANCALYGLGQWGRIGIAVSKRFSGTRQGAGLRLAVQSATSDRVPLQELYGGYRAWYALVL